MRCTALSSEVTMETPRFKRMLAYLKYKGKA